jgi:hypothetical protein
MELPPVDYGQIRERIQSVIGTIQKHDSKERFCSLGARVEFGPHASIPFPDFLLSLTTN